MLADDEEFIVLFNERYPRILDYIAAVHDNNPKRSTIEKEVYSHIKKFILTTLRSMKRRLPFKDSILNKSFAVYLKGPFQIQTWRELALSFPNLIPIDKEIHFADELDSFALQYKNISQVHESSGVSIIKRWDILSKSYPYISKLAKALLVLPYSTAAVESMFSEFKAFKTCYRNRINVENLEASILIEQELGEKEAIITQEMREKYFKLWTSKEKVVEEPSNLIQSSKRETDETQQSEIIFPKSQEQSQESEFFAFIQPSLPILYAQWQSFRATNQNENIDQIDSKYLFKQDSLKRIPSEPIRPEVIKKIKSEEEIRNDDLTM